MTQSAFKQQSFDSLSPMIAMGDIIYGSVNGAGSRLPGNTVATRKFLRSLGDGANSSAPVWDVLSLLDIPDLSSLYSLISHNHSGVYQPVGSYEVTSNKSTDIIADGASNTKYPGVKAIKDYADSLIAGLLSYRGAYDASGNTYPATGGSGSAGAVMKGDMWVISVPGTLGGVAIQVGDFIISRINTPGQTSSNWDTLNTNISYTPEDQANKENSTIDTSTIKYPTVNLLKEGLDTKIDKSVMTTLGDMMYENSTPAPARLAGDTSNTRKFLRTLSIAGVAQAPAWDTLQTGDIPDLSGIYSVLAHNHAGTYEPVLGFTAENVANKSTDMTPSATKYPTVNAVIAGILASIGANYNSAFIPILPNAKAIPLSFINMASGETLIYTVPAGKRAMLRSWNWRVVGVSTIQMYFKWGIGAIKQEMMQVMVTNANQFSWANQTLGFIMEAGEKLYMQTNNAGLSLWPDIIEFDDTSLLKTVKITALPNNAWGTVYTCPANKVAHFVDVQLGQDAHDAQWGGHLLYQNWSNGTRTVYFAVVPNGLSADTTTQINTAAAVNNNVRQAVAFHGTLQAGDTVQIHDDANTDRQIAWVNVWEMPV